MSKKYKAVLNTLEQKGLINTIPVSLEDICRENHIEVEYKYFIGSHIAGQIQVPPDQHCRAVISINSTDPPTRQRFTLAHELGHYFLHRKHIGDGITDDGLYRSGLSTKQEMEANKLAASILMPAKLVNKEVNKIMKKDGVKFPFQKNDMNQVPLIMNLITSLAHMFNVSNQAMSIRIKLHDIYRQYF